MKKKVMLLNSPNEVNKDKKNANYSLFPHIGIVQLATRAKKDFGDTIEISVLDGGISSTSELQKQIISYKPDIVGISVLTPTYSEGLILAQIAKSIGSQVI